MLKYFVVLLFLLAAASAINSHPCRGRRVHLTKGGYTDKLFVYGRNKLLFYEFELNTPGSLEEVHIMVSEFNTTNYTPGSFSSPALYSTFSGLSANGAVRSAVLTVDPTSSGINGFVFNFVKDYYFTFTYLFKLANGTIKGTTYNSKLRNWRFVSCDPVCNARCLGDRCDMSSNVGFIEGNRPAIRINPFNCKCTTPGWKSETWPTCPFFRFTILSIKEINARGQTVAVGSAASLNTLRWTDPFINNDGTTLINLGGKVVLGGRTTSADFALEFNPTTLKVVVSLGKDCNHWGALGAPTNRLRIAFLSMLKTIWNTTIWLSEATMSPSI